MQTFPLSPVAPQFAPIANFLADFSAGCLAEGNFSNLPLAFPLNCLMQIVNLKLIAFICFIVLVSHRYSPIPNK